MIHHVHLSASLTLHPILIRPQNGSMILYNRKKVKYRKDGYCWKKRKDGKTTREDHMKLKVQGVEVRGCRARLLKLQANVLPESENPTPPTPTPSCPLSPPLSLSLPEG